MKAFILPLLVALLCMLALQIEAQTATGFGRRKMRYPDAKKYNGIPTDAHTKKMKRNRQHVLAMLQKQEKQRQARMHTAERTTSVTSERLIAESEYSSATIIDTTFLIYSNGRGSEFDYNSMVYETPSEDWANVYLPGALSSGVVNTSSEPNYIPGVLCDILLSWALPDPASGPPHYIFRYFDSTYLSYDDNNNIVYYSDQPNPDAMADYEHICYNTYDVSNNNVSSLYIQYDPTAVIAGYDTDELIMQIFSGDTLLEDSFSAHSFSGFYPSGRCIYSYDDAGNLIRASGYADSAGIWTEDARYYMTYNADNTINTDSVAFSQFGSWAPFRADSFGYTSGVNYYTYLKTDNYSDGDSLGYSTITSKHIGSFGFPDTVFSYQYGNGVPSAHTPLNLFMQEKSVYTYDSYVNPKIVYTYHFNITDSATGAGYYNATPNGYTYYYYETYASSAVQNIAATSENIKIYPNPATNALIVSFSPNGILSTNPSPAIASAKEGTINELTIINLLGQSLLTGNYNSERVVVNVAGFPAGLYLVRINGSEVRKFVKQ